MLIAGVLVAFAAELTLLRCLYLYTPLLEVKDMSVGRWTSNGQYHADVFPCLSPRAPRYPDTRLLGYVTMTIL